MMKWLWSFILGPTIDEENPEYKNSELAHRNYSAETLWAIFVFPFFLLWIFTDSRFIMALFWGLVLFTALSIRIVPQPQRFIIEFFGSYFATWKPGIHILPPGFSIKNRLTIAVQQVKMFMDSEKHTFNTPEGKSVDKTRSKIAFLDDSAGVVSIFMFCITNPFRATYRVDEFLATLTDRIGASTRSVLSQLKLDDAIRVREEAGKLIASTFLKEGTRDWEIWSALLSESPYDRDTEEWRIATENPFDKARVTRLPSFNRESSSYILYDWGVVFSDEGIVVTSFILSPETRKQRFELLKANRAVRIADRERQADQLRGRGRKQRLQEIAEVLGDEGKDAADYDIADKMTETLKHAKPTIISGALTREVISGLVGFDSGADKVDKNKDKDSSPPKKKV